MSVGQFVRERREHEGLSQTALARLMSGNGRRWYQNTVSRVEQGERGVDAIEIARLAHILRFGVAELFVYVPTPEPCETCENRPPAGFQCTNCGRSA